MKILLRTIYTVTRNEDLTEGRGKRVTVARFLDPSAARSASQGIDVAGSDGEVTSETLHIVCDEPYPGEDKIYGDVFLVGERVFKSYEEFEAQRPENIHKRALAKLTAEEREAIRRLGV